MRGYVGKIVRVDLTLGKITSEPLDEEFAKNYVGGLGFAARILYDEVPPWVDALDPENRLIFATGPVTGTGTPSAGRHTVVAKSPLTGFFGDSSGGGFWGAELKFSGYDMIVIKGKASKPAFLWINDGSVEIRDARSYWGMNARETDRAIRKDLGEKDAKVACIGQAGENLIRIAGIMNDEACRAAARGGLGAVMGSKNLKAIAVRGHSKVPIAEPETFRKLTAEVTKFIVENENMRDFHERGTPRALANIAWGDTPAFNWRSAEFEGWEKLMIPGGYEKILAGTRTCHACPIACRREVSLTKGPYAFEESAEGPEYETLAMFGTNCGCDDIEVIAKANDLCNIYGLDTISAGSVISFAMECYERGILSKDDTNGLELKFGNCDVIIEMIHKIAKREDFGNILAEGVRRAARIIGKGAEEYAIHVKGMELPAHDPRAWRGGAYYASIPSGGRHTEGMPLGWYLGVHSIAVQIGAPKGKATLEDEVTATILCQNWKNFIISAGWCIFPSEFDGYPSAEHFTTIYSAVTGVKTSIQDALKLGERIFTLRRCFNMKHGATQMDDSLPKRLMTEKNTKSKSTVELEKTLPLYYKLRGWDIKTGKPTTEKLLELGLKDTEEEL